jgi:4'-phosphopantetheinyl transferase
VTKGPETAAPSRTTAGAGSSRVACSVWWATPTATPPLTGLLDTSERRRASRLVGRGDRERYVTAHALVRLLLAERTGVPAADLRFDRTCRHCAGDHGKPRLVDAPAESSTGPVSFNLAHSGGRIVVAIAHGPDLEVGVDVERIPGPDDPAVATDAAGILSARELAAFRRLRPAQRDRALAVWWTRKEAVLKATGDGLAVPPSTVEVTPPSDPPALAHQPAPGDDHDSLISAPYPGRPPAGHPPVLSDLEPGAGYVGCVAALGATSIEVIEHDAGPLLSTA